jgi:hypothetical protein
MLLLVSFALLILTMPRAVRLVIYMFIEPTSNYFTFGMYYFVSHLSFLLSLTNHAVNFYLYCLSGSRFRKDLRDFILCEGSRSVHQASDTGKSGSSTLSLQTGSLPNTPI